MGEEDAWKWVLQQEGWSTRSLSDIAVRHGAKEGKADARPQARKPEAYSLEYGEDFSGPRTK